MRKKILLILVLFIFVSLKYSWSQESYFYPNSGKFNPAIPTPEQFLGYPIGGQHTRHDRLVEYFQELDRLSDRVSV